MRSMIQEATSKCWAISLLQLSKLKKGLSSRSLEISSSPREPSELDFYLMT